MPLTYDFIAKTILSGNAHTITFSSIPSTYTDILIKCRFVKSSNDNFWLNFNGDGASNYSETMMHTNGTTAGSSRETTTTRILLTNGVGYGNNGIYILQIFSYANTSFSKTVLSRNGDSGIGVGAGVGLWRNTAAISSLSITTQSYAPWGVGTTFSLYGIKAA
jgi:hypothetical protein